MFKDLVQEKHISSKLMFRDVVAKLDQDREGVVQLNAFIAWIESVSPIEVLCGLSQGYVLNLVYVVSARTGSVFGEHQHQM